MIKRLLIKLGILQPKITLRPYVTPPPHDHQYALVPTGADCIYRCVTCGEPESKVARIKREEEHFRSRVIEAVAADIKAGGRIAQVLK